MQPIRRTIHPEARVISASEGIVEYTASDETLDHYREIIRASGWRFDHFKKNAPFVDSHEYNCIDRLLGRVTEYQVKDGRLVERVRYALDVPSCSLARFAFEMVEKGYLKAVSVGFIPEKTVYRTGEGFAALCEEMKLDTATAATLRAIYTQQQQIELSQCIIGANPNALAKAFKDGAASEEQMARLGFAAPDAMEFLHLGADAETRGALADPLMLALYRRECQRLYLSSGASRRGFPQTDLSPGTRAGGDDPQRRAIEEESRTEFLRKLKGLCS